VSTPPRKPGARIHLARHLASSRDVRGAIDHRGFAQLLREYDGYGVAETSEPFLDLLEAVRRSLLLVSSPLLRATETVLRVQRVLGAKGPPHEVWDVLREAEQPALGVPFVRVPQGVWDVLSRLVWALGWPGNAESRSAAEARACRAADRLAAVTDAMRGDLTVVGHGCQNILIARALRGRGWRGPRIPSTGHGNVTTYVR
jgi:broad specificity phosphatase PhoE